MSKKTKTPKDREKAALKFFNQPEGFGCWLLRYMDDGYEANDDGRGDVQTECPDDAKHARAITARQYAKVMRDNLVKYLKTEEGLNDLRATTDKVYSDLTSDLDGVGDEDEEEEEDDGLTSSNSRMR